jgi:hypothetical protein
MLPGKSNQGVKDQQDTGYLMKKIGLLGLVLLLALGGLGIGYAGWSQNLTMNATMVTAAGIARVQYVSGTSTTTTVSATWSKATTAGNLLIAIISYDHAGEIKTIPAGWTLAIGAQDGNNISTAIYYIGNAGSQSGSSSWVLTHSRNITLHLLEYSGVDTLDKTANASGNGNTASTGITATTTQADELAIGAMAVSDYTGFYYVSGGFSEVGSEVHIGYAITSEPLEQVLSVTGRYGATALISWDHWAGAVAAFK